MNKYPIARVVTSERREEPRSVPLDISGEACLLIMLARLSIPVPLTFTVSATASTTCPRTLSLWLSDDKFLKAPMAFVSVILAKERADSLRGMTVANIGLDADDRNHDRL